MRIILEKNFGNMKATVFSLGDKLSIKYEANLNEIIVKFRENTISTFDIQSIFLNTATLEKYENLLNQCDIVKADLLYNNSDLDDSYPTIV